MNKFFLSFILILFLVGAGLFFIFNDSYQKSLEAKYHYYTGDYERALELATESFQMDNYNKMAITVMQHSKVSLRYVHFIQEAQKNQQKIAEIGSQPQISPQDKIRVKIICEIIMGEYETLSEEKSVVLNKTLLEEAHTEYLWFKKLYEDVYH